MRIEFETLKLKKKINKSLYSSMYQTLSSFLFFFFFFVLWRWVREGERIYIRIKFTLGLLKIKKPVFFIPHLLPCTVSALGKM